MARKSVKERPNQFKVVPDDRFWGKFKHSKLVCRAVQSSLEIQLICLKNVTPIQGISCLDTWRQPQNEAPSEFRR
jgi:hypothetical protein